MESFDSLEQCEGYDLLSWVKYPLAASKVVYVHPRYAVTKEGLVKLDESLFPDRGAIALTLSGVSPADVRERFGEVVLAHVKSADCLNDLYLQGENENKYHAHLNSLDPRGMSDIVLKKFGASSVSNELVQIVSASRPIDLDDSRVQLEDVDTVPLSTLLIVEQDDGVGGWELVGPFEYEVRGSALALKGSNPYRMRALRLPVEAFEGAYSVDDMRGAAVASFVPKAAVDAAFERADEANVIDLVTDASLMDALRDAVKAASEGELSKAKVRSMRRAVETCAEVAGGVDLDQRRKDRIGKLLDTCAYWSGLPEQFADKLLEKSDGEMLAEYVLADDVFPRFSEKVLSHPQVEARIAEARRKVEHDLARLEEKRKAKEQELAEVSAGLSKARADLEAVKQEALAKGRQELADLQREISEEEGRLAEARRQHEAVLRDKDVAFEEVSALMENLDDQMTKKLIEHEMMQRIAYGVSDRAGSCAESDGGSRFALPAKQADPAAPSEDVVAQLTTRIERSGRLYSKNDVVNLALCLCQGFITTIAGEPGTGKTSLCNILAGALGLTGAASRYLELATDPSWASPKDYIGYYNPLSRRFEKSDAQAFDAVSYLSKEDPDGAPPFVFMLDEANLSPIEHYWAPFLHSCDTFHKGIDLSLGGEDAFRLPPYTRFLATVNFDHTTEALSSRFLDRSWVVMLEPEEVDFEDREDALDVSEEEAFSYETLMGTFGARSFEDISPELKESFKDILRICANHGRPVSQRSQAMAWRYLSTADKLMDTEGKDGKLVPLDYAVSQKVLPLLAGTTDEVENLLEELFEHTKDTMPKTSGHLERMLRKGKRSGYYQFFA